MEETIELRELFAIVMKRKWLIALCIVLCMSVGVFYSYYMVTPMYRSYTTLMVNGAKGLSSADFAETLNIGSINLSQKLVVTYGEIIKSRLVMEQVIDKLELEMGYGTLLSMTSAQQVGATEILRIVVQDVNPERAALIANTISEVFIKEVMRILKVNNVETIDAAIPMNYAVNIKTQMNIAIAMVLGAMVGVFIAFVLEYLDRSIKTENDVEKYLDLPVMGVIPDFRKVVK